MIGFDRWAKKELKRRVITPPNRKEQWTLRILIVLGVLAMGLFVVWFARREHIGFWPLYLMLTTAIGFKFLRLLHEWYHYWQMTVPARPEVSPEYSVDMLTTYVAGEPYQMIEETLRAMVAVSYPHRTFLCDEANDPHLKAFCAQLGVVHVYRGENKTNAKAGNINYALRHEAEGEIAVILDPDHVPAPDFLDRVLPYFADPDLGYVQCMQTYGNQEESFVAKGAAEQTYTFYGPMMMGMNAYGTAQAIGANCTFRRAALDDIGGHAPGLSEDMHTAMQIHAKGWKSIYVPEQLTRGRVPFNLPAYYKQQLKWSRGTFELLFRVYPKLFRGFTWRQKLHYFLLPLHFLSGLITLLDISVPILSLVLALVPWQMNLIQLAQMVTPLLVLMLVIRQYSQRWMLEERERGFHLLGGILWAGTWWYSLVGLVYAIFNIKVPYIPTPKEDEFTNAWKLSLPNILAIGLSVIAIVYGLRLDWNPYSFAMAGFALINIFVLVPAVLTGQQKFMQSLQDGLKLEKIITSLRSFWWNFRHYLFYPVLRQGGAVIALLALTFWGLYGFVNEKRLLEERAKVLSVEEPEAWFYLGSEEENQLKRIPPTQRLVPMMLSWQPGGMNEPETQRWQEIQQTQAMPLLDWLPTAEGFAELADDSLLRDNRHLLGAISQGKFDFYLRAFARQMKDLNQAVFIRFAPRADEAGHPWSLSPQNCPQDYRNAWEYVAGFLSREGLSNLVWVWEAKRPALAVDLLPRPEFVSWFSVNDDRELQQLQALADSVLAKKGFEQKPVILTVPQLPELNWNQFAQKHPQVRALLSRQIPQEVLQSEDRHWAGPPQANSSGLVSSTLYRSPFLQKENGSWRWIVDGEPFYVRGIAYNATHDWRDGFLPLTRDQLTRDFQKIKAMGANAIRRFDAGWYDYNVLNVADEQGLKVQFGLWLDPSVDYHSDSLQREAIRQEILQQVGKHKDHPALLAWTLGNETWTSLQYHFRMPYLVSVRRALLGFMNQLAEDIHQLDPGHPIVAALEHSDHLPALLQQFKARVPAVDIVGINSFAGERMENLPPIMERFWGERPYLLTSFGPRKYWDPRSPEYKSDRMLEQVSSFAKARAYTESWENHIAKHQAQNLGGFAYCWSDRLEGAATWFGITDFKGRLKPAYYALKSVWTGEKFEPPLANLLLIPPEFQPKPWSASDYHAVTPNNGRDDLHYEYLLLSESLHKEVGKLVPVEGDPTAILVYFPRRENSYRLYLYLSDEEGNVVTASHRIVYFEKDD
jgi:cellulose synthase (UDP-forming)